MRKWFILASSCLLIFFLPLLYSAMESNHICAEINQNKETEQNVGLPNYPFESFCTPPFPKLVTDSQIHDLVKTNKSNWAEQAGPSGFEILAKSISPMFLGP